MRLHTYVLAATITTYALSATALADMTGEEEEHFDVWVQNDLGQIVIGAVNEEGTAFFSGVRVFGAEFGEDPLLPFFAAEPGFQATDGTFDPMTLLQVNINDAVTRWTGGGFGAAGETITLAFGGNDVTSGAGFTPGFSFATDSGGGFHDHFDITLNGDGGDPTLGIYLLPLSLQFAGEGSGVSDPFWFVMNLGMSEADHEAAIEWVELNLVPAPGALFLLATAGLFGRTRRRQ